MKWTKRSSRRQFFKAGVVTAVFSIVPRHVLGGRGYVAPSDKVNIALIGAGGQGRTNTRELFKQKDAQVIAIADPAESFSLEKYYYKGMGGRLVVQKEVEKHYADKTPNHRCAVYEDFRTMLEKEKAIDAVLCATPDHLHAYVSAVAMRAGKHVYCEKPLTHNIWEARQVARIAKESGVATQMGNQGHSSDGIRETCEWLLSGVLGPVRHVHAWVGSPRWNPSLTGRPSDKPPVPAGLNWDLWLGPREPRPFHPAYFPVAWRDFWAFGSSNLGDFGCHDLDAACWALDLHVPLSVETRSAPKPDKEIGPHGSIAYYRFSGSDKNPPVQITWYDGGLAPEWPRELAETEKLPARGVLFACANGSLLCGGAGGKPRLLGRKQKELSPPKPTLPRSPGHHREWLDACKGGPSPGSNFEYGARLTEIVLLGVLSLRTGQRIDWDAQSMKAKGVPAADAIIKEAYRKGWEIV